MLSFKNDYCLIIAEVGINHNGSLEMALEMVDEAAKAGVDIVKFQNISEETGFNFAVKDDAIFEAVRSSSLDLNDYVILKNRCIEKGVQFLSSGADVPAVRFLTSLGVPGLKVSSGNFTNFHLIKEISRYDLPTIFSTGMSDLDEIEEVVNYIRKCKISNFALTYCVSAYPAQFESIDLEIMEELKKRYNVPVGFSDHTEGIISSIVARAKGACILEKHFTLDKNLPGPDHSFSLLPHEFKELVSNIRNMETILFSIKYENAGEEKSKMKMRRSMYFNKAMRKGEIIGFDDIAAKRPNNERGISPKHFYKLIGKVLNQNVEVDQLIKKDSFSSDD